MSKHMTIINLACTITKVRKWGEGWKHSAESAHAAFAELHRKHKEAERTIETLRANLTQTESECQAELAVVKDERDQLRVERDALRAQLDTERQKVREWIAENAYQDGDALRAEVERLKPLSPKYKVGDKLEWQKLGLSPCSVTVTGIRLVYDCIGEGAEYPVGHSEGELREPASHITPEGKQTAEGALPQPGDVVRLVRVPTNDEYPHDSGRWEPNWGGIDDHMRVHYVGSNITGIRVVRAVFGLEWPVSCVEVVKGADK